MRQGSSRAKERRTIVGAWTGGKQPLSLRGNASQGYPNQECNKKKTVHEKIAVHTLYPILLRIEK